MLKLGEIIKRDQEYLTHDEGAVSAVVGRGDILSIHIFEQLEPSHYILIFLPILLTPNVYLDLKRHPFFLNPLILHYKVIMMFPSFALMIYPFVLRCKLWHE